MGDLCGGIWRTAEKVIYRVMSGLFKILKKEVSSNVFDSIMQFVKFGIVGLSNTLLSYGIYVIALLVLQRFNILARTDYLVAQLVAFILSVLWSFYWNNKMVFATKEGEERNLWETLIKTYISYSFTGLFLNSVLLLLWVRILHISEFIAPIINLVISVPLNFLINKFWTFNGRHL